MSPYYYDEPTNDSPYAPKNRLPEYFVNPTAPGGTNRKNNGNGATQMPEEAPHLTPWQEVGFDKSVGDGVADIFARSFSPAPVKAPEITEFFEDLNKRVTTVCGYQDFSGQTATINLYPEIFIQRSSPLCITSPNPDRSAEARLAVLYQFNTVINNKRYALIPDIESFGIKGATPRPPEIVSGEPISILAYTGFREMQSTDPQFQFRVIVSRRSFVSVLHQFHKQFPHSSAEILTSSPGYSEPPFRFQLINSLLRPQIERALMNMFEIGRREYEHLRDTNVLRIIPMKSAVTPESKQLIVIVERSDRHLENGYTTEKFQFEFTVARRPTGIIRCAPFGTGIPLDEYERPR